MAPFIPQGIINPELNLFFALVLGIGFGYVLEQAGFSSAKKLAGVFYGYDFVVLRVFFTAGITAMTGILFLSYLGWLDMDFVFVNPTYLHSALVGGAIMGFGFIMGGYCPGTSVVAAVTGKIDAFVFILGMFIGIFIFGHFYHQFEPLYTGSFLGNIFVYDSLGISRPWFALILAVVALLAFAITQMIEDRVNGVSPQLIKARPSHILPSMLLIAALFVFLFLPEERRSKLREASPPELLASIHGGDAYVSSHRVILEIRQNRDELILIDTRSQEEYQRFTLPGAIHMEPHEVLQRRWRPIFRKDKRTKVFFGNGNGSATEAYMTAARAGHENLRILQGGLNRMFSELFVDSEMPDTTAYNLQDRSNARFLYSARQFFLEGGLADREEEARPTIRAPEESEVIPVIGGC